jgi:hypothetical protein
MTAAAEGGGVKRSRRHVGDEGVDKPRSVNGELNEPAQLVYLEGDECAFRPIERSP